MFDSLTNKWQKVFKDRRGLGKITDSNVTGSLREVRTGQNFKSQNLKSK